MTYRIDILGYARTGREFEVMDSLAAAGIECWRGERIEFERRGTKRTPEAYTYPALPNYVWARPTEAQLHMMVSVKNLAPTVQFLSRRSAQLFGAFRDDAERMANEARRIVGDRRAITQYQRGEKLEIRDGAFAGELATFSRLVEHSWMMHPMIEVEWELFGRIARIEVDPLSVRKAG